MSNRILGIDPGMALMGYGLIDDNEGELSAIDYGALSTPAEQSVPQRLRSLYRGVCDIIERYQPAEVAVELFVARNLRTALMVGQARGVAILAAANKDLPVYEYTPLQVKLAVSGYGRGDKRQIQEMVKLQLGLSSIPEPDDAADALAIAICHTGQTRLLELLATQR
ncbi:crossover junction endodeoxyribonuclease RuvC [Chloroflexota bacterium]